MYCETVTEAINALKKKGYQIDLNIAFNPSLCEKIGVCLQPKDFDIMEVFRFEGDSNPSDEDVVYAMASKNRKIKGIYSGAYGVYSESII